ncbi:hypothetical protein D3C80_1192580 [compost metagenome]
MQDQYIAVPVTHALQVEPFVGAVQPDLLRKATNLFGEPGGDFAMGQLSPFGGAGMAQQLFGEGRWKLWVARLDHFGAGHPGCGQRSIVPLEFAVEHVRLSQFRALLKCLIELEARQGVFQLRG